mmetsp:Transcript_11372/g.28005  ORF Transcript_11372/g.28005 Transcript_11372/m.28005 type:complete len:200 (-) Transcript_11372:940-1539(-)
MFAINPYSSATASTNFALLRPINTCYRIPRVVRPTSLQTNPQTIHQSVPYGSQQATQLISPPAFPLPIHQTSPQKSLLSSPLLIPRASRRPVPRSLRRASLQTIPRSSRRLNLLIVPLMFPRSSQLHLLLLIPPEIQHLSQLHLPVLNQHLLQRPLPLHLRRRGHPQQSRQMCLNLPKCQRRLQPSSQLVEKMGISTCA